MIIKSAFWFAIVVAFIPVEQTQLAEGERKISVLETVSAAKTIFDDAGNFCERNAQACEIGSELASQMGLKAQRVSEIAYKIVNDNFDGDLSAALQDGADLLTSSAIVSK